MTAPEFNSSSGGLELRETQRKSGPAINIVPDVPFCCCMPWHARAALFVTRGNADPVHGGVCCFCDRDVAVPSSARGKRVACIYCGMDRGFIAEAEIEPFAGEHQDDEE